MKNGPIFELILGKIILDEQEDKGDFDNLINDLHHHHNYIDNIGYVSDVSDDDDNILGSWEA